MTPTCLTKPVQALPTDRPNLAPTSSCERLPLNHRVVLHAVGQMALTVAPGSWDTLSQGDYFGLGATDLDFKEMLLPFVWVGRQQLIARVGAAYQQVTIAARASLERELLATLNALCLQGLRAAHPELSLSHAGLVDDYCRRGWQVFCREQPHLAHDLADTLGVWVDSMVRLLDQAPGPLA